MLTVHSHGYGKPVDLHLDLGHGCTIHCPNVSSPRRRVPPQQLSTFPTDWNNGYYARFRELHHSPVKQHIRPARSEPGVFSVDNVDLHLGSIGDIA